jgi:hypothetical protein
MPKTVIPLKLTGETLSAEELNMIVNNLPSTAFGQYTASVYSNDLISNDNSIPQITEGLEVISATINLKSIASKVRIRCNMPFRPGNGSGESQIIAVFRNLVPDAIAAAAMSAFNPSSNQVLPLVSTDSPGIAGDVTYTMRVGASAGGMFVNPNFAGIGKVTMELTEVF